jgi:hypothetical protein
VNLVPALTLPAGVLSTLTRERATSELAPLSPDALGGAFWADVLFVSARKRKEIQASEQDALSKAIAGLGYSPLQTALLCLGDAGVDALAAYVEVLTPQTVVFLEPEACVATGPGQTHMLPDDTFPYTKVVLVSDFFAALNSPEKKRVVWEELKTCAWRSVLP